ncbi:MAG: hypothetical protein LBH38_03260 [Holosporales bacterium]|nr:hypothetical protein [Holosporales bacterium]
MREERVAYLIHRESSRRSALRQTLLQQVVSLFDREPDTDIATLAAPIATHVQIA